MSSPVEDMMIPTECERDSDMGKGGRIVAADHPPGLEDCSCCLSGGEDDEEVLGLAGAEFPPFDAPLDLL